MVEPAVAPGLCGRCRHRRLVVTRRDTAYVRCDRSATDVRFPRYPRLPVVRCSGFEDGPAGVRAAGPGG